MGLSVSDFDVVTLKQFRVMQRMYRDHFEYQKEVDSHVISTALYNSHRKKGSKCEKVWPEKPKPITEQSIEEMELQTDDLFGF